MNRLRAALGFLLLFVSHPVFACAVCGQSGEDPTLDAYQGSTAMLSLVPLAAMGGIVFGIYKYINRGEAVVAEEEVTPDEK